jgi:hypothetical protein
MTIQHRNNLLEQLRSLFDEIYVIDTEYRQPTGNIKELRCLCAINCFTGEKHQLWFEDGQSYPFELTSKILFIVYAAGAEAGYFFRTGWPTRNVHIFDARLLQLWILSGNRLWDQLLLDSSRAAGHQKVKRDLQAAASMVGLPLVRDKAEMRDLIMADIRTPDYSTVAKGQIMSYCMEDVKTTLGAAIGLWDIAKDEIIKMSNNSEQREIYETRVKILKDKVSALNQAREQGIEQGQKNKSIEIAKNLLDILDYETVSLKTGLTIEEVMDIRTRTK